MEKDNKSLPMRVFSNTMSSFPLDTKPATATTMLTNVQQSSHRHTIHPRLTDIQICPNEIIDLTTNAAATAEMIPVNLNAKARSYELTKINKMMSIYEVNNQNASFSDIGSGKVQNVVNSLDILQGISKGKYLLGACSFF